MGEDLQKLVEDELEGNTSHSEIKEKLEGQGFLEEDVDQAINKATNQKAVYGDENSKKLTSIFSKKEVFDRVGYGFVPTQFINILFYLTGANYLWLGIINGARTVISIILSSLFQEYSKVRQIGKGVISKAGYLFGFSFLGMAFATVAKSVELFAFFLLLGSIGVVTAGDFYNKLVKRHLKREKMGYFLARITNYGVLMTGVCMLISGWLLDKYPPMKTQMGYLISFEITAIAFILSGYMLSHVKEELVQEKVKGFFGDYVGSMKAGLGTFMKNKHLFLLIFTTIIMGFVQVLGNSYYGVYIYQQFKYVGYGGFLNVAVIYFIAIIASFVGPWFSRFMNKTTGLAPTLVFGTLLSSMMPFALAYNPNLVAIGAANALSVVGAAILGVSQGMLAGKLLRGDERKVYFSVMSVAAVIPFIIVVPLGAYFAQLQGLVPLFKVLGFALVAAVAPLYIILVLMGSRKRL